MLFVVVFKDAQYERDTCLPVKDKKGLLLLLLCTVISLMMTTIDPIRNVKLLSVNIK